MSNKTNSIRIDVSIGVHTRLLKFGSTFPQRVNALLACKEIVLNPVRRPMGQRKGIHISTEAHSSLLIAQQALKCSSLSNVLESMLNTDPKVPFKTQLTMEQEDEPIRSNIRIKLSDHAKIKALSEKAGVTIWMMVHYLVEAYHEDIKGEEAKGDENEEAQERHDEEAKGDDDDTID